MKLHITLGGKELIEIEAYDGRWDDPDDVTIGENEAWLVINAWQNASEVDEQRASYDLSEDGILMLVKADETGIEMGAWYQGDIDWPLENFPFRDLSWELKSDDVVNEEPGLDRIMFRQRMSATYMNPWPIIIDRDGSIISGRPDADHLVGFGPKGEMEVTVFWRDALADPNKAVGLVPTFTGSGEMFSVDLPVVTCGIYVATDETVADLRKREEAMRIIYRNDV